MKKIFTLILALISINSITGRSYYPNFTSVQGGRYPTDEINLNPWREITSNGSESLLYSINANYHPGERNCSFICGDKLYLFSTQIFTNFDYVNSIAVFDALTGETISDSIYTETYDGSKSLKGIAYDANENIYYLLTYKYSNNYDDCSLYETWLQKYDPKTKQCSYIATMQSVWTDIFSLAYNPLDGKLYVTNLYGEIGILNKTTGLVEKIADLPIPESLVYGNKHSMTYSLVDNAFIISYFSYLDNTYTNIESGTILFDTQTKKSKNITSYKGMINKHYHWMANPDVFAVAQSPQKPIVYINYPQASTTGCIDITIPSYSIDSTPLSGIVYIDVTIDDITTKLSGKPGENLSLPMDLKEGKHRLGIKSYQVVDTDTTHGVGAHCLFFVGNDKPQAPTNVVLDHKTIKWDKVSNIGVNNGYVDSSNVKYNVYLNDKKLNNELIADNQFSFDIDIPDKQLPYQAQVEAIIDFSQSDRSVSNKIYLGNSYNLPTSPYLFDFATQGTKEAVITINGENDSFYWEFNPIGQGFGYALYPTAWAGTCNDWIVLPKISFDKAISFYEINIYAFLNYLTGGKYEIGFSSSTDPKDIKYKKSLSTKFHYHNREEESIKIFIPEAGDYYVMINPITSAVDNLFIQYINFDYAKNIVELDGEYAFRTRTTKLNWTNNLHTDPLIKIKGYNIYRDCKLLAQVDNSTTSYNDKISNDENRVNHEYCVSIRYEHDGKEYETDLSNTFTATYEYGSVEGVVNHDVSIYSIANEIIIEGAPIGSTLSITSIDGKLLHSDIIKSDKEIFNVRKGAYLITLNGKTTKIIVN